jgi:hypothetical protein
MFNQQEKFIKWQRMRFKHRTFFLNAFLLRADDVNIKGLEFDSRPFIANLTKPKPLINQL